MVELVQVIDFACKDYRFCPNLFGKNRSRDRDKKRSWSWLYVLEGKKDCVLDVHKHGEPSL